jgi:serine/threonine protein kinase
MANPQVTERYAEEEPPKPVQVTQIYPSQSAQFTERYVDEPLEKVAKKTPPRPGLALGTVIADRYCIQDGPLGIASGEADVYQCFDNLKQGLVAVKLYHAQTAPKESVIQILKQLNHPNIVTLYEYGEWQGRFYEVMEFCSGGVMSDYMPLPEAELRAALPGLIHALEHCHRQGIIHRDIKPNNLFFNHPVERQPLIGDFGISSYLEQDNSIRRTQTAANLTLDYAAPELLDGHEVSAKTDYYSLGITLLHLFLGRSPFQGLTPNDILVTHLRGRVSLPDNLSLEFHQLLRGLTLPNMKDRWGYQEVLAWLRGENVPLRLDSLQQADLEKGCKPYPGYPKVRTKEELAQNLDQFDAFKQLERGDIRRWIFDNINQVLAEEIACLESDYADRPQLALYKLKGLLDSNTPLVIGERKVSNLAELLALLSQAETEPKLTEELRQALWDEYLESWLISHKPGGQRNAELVAKVTTLRQRLHYKAPETALFALYYMLEPQAPVKITPDLALTAPHDLAAVFKKSPTEVEMFLTDFIYSLRFEEWLRAGEFLAWEKDLQFIETIRRFYLENKKQGTYCILWHYYPQLPFVFAGQHFTEPHLLARAIDASCENTVQGMQLLENGWLRTWLVGSGKITTPIELDAALLDTNTSLQSKLEAVLHLLDPSLPYPQVESSLTELNFQMVAYGESKTRSWALTNLGRGYLNGEILLVHYGQGLSLNSYLVEGDEQSYQVTLKVIPSLSEGLHTNALRVRSNGGEIEIPVRFIVRARPKEKRSLWQALLDHLF